MPCWTDDEGNGVLVAYYREFGRPSAFQRCRRLLRGNELCGRPLGSLSARERHRLLHTKEELPAEWIVCDEGYITPESYICKDRVERLFRSPRRMNYFLQNSSKAKIRLEASEDCQPSFRDQVILAALPDLCRSLFRNVKVAELSECQLVELMRQLRFRFAANVNQIARVTGVSYERAAQLLDRA